MTRKDHWEAVYTTKASDEVSWYEVNPQISLDLIQKVSPAPRSIIDVGGGESFLVDRLLETGVEKLAVLDISSAALQRTIERLGERAGIVDWIEADVTKADGLGTFELWHDRAVFHFLTDPQDRMAYLELAAKTISSQGHLVIGTFGLDGPDKCSGLPVCQYDADLLAKTFGDRFELLHSQSYTHTTPSGSTQNFCFGLFRRV